MSDNGKYDVVDNINHLLNENHKLKELLKAAKCPNCNGGGVHLDIDSEYIKCEWCDEVNKLKGEG